MTQRFPLSCVRECHPGLLEITFWDQGRLEDVDMLGSIVEHVQHIKREDGGKVYYRWYIVQKVIKISLI